MHRNEGFEKGARVQVLLRARISTSLLRSEQVRICTRAGKQKLLLRPTKPTNRESNAVTLECQTVDGPTEVDLPELL